VKVSVITICFNSAETIEDTIKSVLSQNYRDLEYIIVDGASRDSTIEIVSNYAERIHHILSEPDKGIYDAMNKGVALASGDIIGILNSDDVYVDNQVISDVVQRFKESGADGVYADLEYVDRNDLSRVIRRWKAGPYLPGHFLKGWMPPHPTFFVKKECYTTYGQYNLQLRSAADYELMLRFIHRYRIKLSYLPRVIIKMRVGGQSNVSLRNRVNANLEDRQAWEINGLRPGWLTLLRKPLSKLSQYWKR
jgi:glycosyltransferase involved in cell wall biosynthesis